jgi:hypothetical protein
MTEHATLEAFLADKCEGTRAKYAAELANAEEWAQPLDHWYAESLVHFGLLERRVETLFTDGGRVRGSRAWFKKAPKCTTTVSIKGQFQTEMAL